MPNPHKVKFKEDGSRCTKNLQKLRRLPECGIFDRDIIPFHPVHPPPKPPHDPKHPFHPFKMSIPGVLNDRLIPDQPERPNPVFPDENGTLVGGATGPGSQYSAPQLPQDQTNILFRGSGRALHEESRFGIKPTFFAPKGYHTVPVELQGGDSLARPIQPANYRNEDADRVIQSMDDILGSRPRRVDQELENMLADTIRETGETMTDDGAGVIPRPRRMLIADPRDTEFIETPRQKPRRFRRPSRSNGSRTNESRSEALESGSASTPSRQPSIETTNPGARRGLNFDPVARRGLTFDQEPILLDQEPIIRQRSDQQRRFGMRNVETELSNLTQIPESDVPDMMVGRKRRGDYFEVDQGSPSRYRVKVSRRGSSLVSRATQLSRNIGLASQAAKKMRLSFTESLTRRSSEALQDIRAATVRQFGQGYERVVSDSQGIRMAQAISGERPIGGGMPIDIEMGTIRSNVVTNDVGDITVRRPVTEDVTGLRTIDLDFSPFDQVVDEPTVIGRTAPKLSFSNRIGTARSSFRDVTVRSTATGAAGAGVGFLAGMGVSQLLSGVDLTHNKLGNSSLVGGLSGAAGDLTARTALAIGARTFGRSAATAAADTALYGGMRAGSAILRGGTEGFIIGAAAAPLDLLLNDALIKSGAFSHAGANTVSSSLVGLGTTATIGAISLAAAPETLGLSLVVGALATLGSVIFGAITGHQQDEKEKEDKRKQEVAQQKVINTANARKQLLESLPSHNFNFQQALNAFSDKSGLGVGDETWGTFQSSSMKLFVVRPSNSPAPGPGNSGAAASGDQKRLNDLFSKYITHSLIARICSGGTDCADLRSRDHGDLTPDEATFLNDKTGNTWQPQADMQVEMSVQELQYTHQRIGDAKKKMVDAWNENQTLPNQLDPYVTDTAYLDSKWERKFNTAIKLDAQEKVIDAYADNQTKMEHLSRNIQTAAGYDPGFSTTMHAYYDDMENTASKLEVEVSQLLELQSLEGEKQRSRYQEMQFDRIKTQKDVVEQATGLAAEEDSVRAAGFYDIDQAFLDGADPTDILQWHPSDSQILQAHASGMNLDQYVAYMHQLSLGDAGDFQKLPTYTEKQLHDSGVDDYAHLKNNLMLAGLDPKMYAYDDETRTFTLNPNATNIPDLNAAKRFLSTYTPAYLTKARREYADMIHGLNEKNQAQVDAYNTNLLKDLQAYGSHYNDMVASQNEYLISHSGPVTNLLHYHVKDAFDKYRLDYNPLSESLPTKAKKIVDGNTVSAPNLPAVVKPGAMERSSIARGLQSEKQRKTTEAAAKYGMTVPQWHQLKTNVSAKGVQNTPQQLAKEVEIVKNPVAV